MSDELIAGKFKDDAALEQGIREGIKATTGVEIPATVKVIGEGGIYASRDAAVTAYKGVESAIGKLKAPPPKADDSKPITLTPPPPPDVEYDDPADAVRAAGLDMAALETQWAKEGKLTDEQYTALKTKGKLTKAAVNAWASGIAAQKGAAASSYEATLLALGGRDKVKSLVAEAERHVPKEQVPVITKMLADPQSLPAAIKLLQAYASEGRGSDMATGSGTSTSSGVKREDLPYLIRKAANGDAAAMAAVSRIDTNAILGRKG